MSSDSRVKTKEAKTASSETIVKRLGKDEMNLVEYPFAALSFGESRTAVIHHEWEVPHPVLKGKTVKASWRVTGDPELGLPSPLDEQVYLVLMELTAESGWQQEVHFSRHDLIRRLGWPVNKKYFDRITECFKRLNAVTITADYCFYDRESRVPRQSVGFHVIDKYDIGLEPTGRKKQGSLPVSWFKWNDDIYKSIRANYIRPLDLDFALSLERPLSLRLFRYLDKKRYGGRKVYSVGIRKLCEKHLGMKPARPISNLKQNLAAAHQELTARGFLHGMVYLPMTSQDGEKVLYTFGDKLKATKPAVVPQAAREPQETPRAMLKDAQAYKNTYEGLGDDIKAQLMQEARQGVADMFWERLDNPESPVSWKLWELVDKWQSEQ